MTDQQLADDDPELAVLSAMAHGRDPDQGRALEIAVAALGASVGLDGARALLYADLVAASLGEAARKALQAMDPAKYEFQSEFAKRYLAEGRAELVLKLLTLRFGSLDEATEQRVRQASVEELDRFAERIITAATLDEVLR